MAFHLRWRGRVDAGVNGSIWVPNYCWNLLNLVFFLKLVTGMCSWPFCWVKIRLSASICESIVVSQHPMCPGEWWEHRSKGAIRSPSDFTDFTDQSKWLPACLAKLVCFTQRCIWCIQWIQGFTVYSTYVAVRGRWCIKPVILQSFMMKLPLAALNLVGKALQEQMDMQVDDKAVTGDSRSKLHDFGWCKQTDS